MTEPTDPTTPGDSTHPGEPTASSEPTEASESSESSLDPASRPSSHRAPLAAPPVLARLLAPTSAVAVVVVVILLLIWINGHSTGHKTSAGSTRAAPTASIADGGAPTPLASAPPTPTGTPLRSSAPSPRPSHHTSSSSHPHHGTGRKASAPPAPAHRHHTAPPGAAVATAPVTVLNNSRRTGLAHAVAAELAAKGWHIAFVGNLQGLVPVSTVYYATGEFAAARHLAAEFPSVHSVQPNASGRILGSGLTLVVTADWVI